MSWTTILRALHRATIAPPPAPIVDDPTIKNMREAERQLRREALLITRDLRHGELAKLQRRLARRE